MFTKKAGKERNFM